MNPEADTLPLARGPSALRTAGPRPLSDARAASATASNAGPSGRAASGPSDALRRAALERAVKVACARIAPLWPLTDFVAVNPFLGFTGESFAQTVAAFRRVARADILMPRAFYREALAAGDIDEAALELARARTGAPAGLGTARSALLAAASRPPAPDRDEAAIATVAEVLDRLADGDREASLVGFMVDQISRWCAAYFDAGQASWRMPVRGLPPYAAWRATARHDRGPEVMGVGGFRGAIAALPEDPVAAIGVVVAALGIPPHATEEYLHRALLDIRGWAAYARHLDWSTERSGGQGEVLVGLLAIRIAYGFGLFEARTDPEFRGAWASAVARASGHPSRAGDLDPDLALDLLLHEAYELTFQRRFAAQLSAPVSAAVPTAPLTAAPAGVPMVAPTAVQASARAPDAAPAQAPGGQPRADRPRVQAVFCIDVRSEVLRRRLEATSPDLETLGFAGFFGFPIEYLPLGQDRGRPHCPVLLQPTVTVTDTVSRDAPAPAAEVARRRGLRLRWSRAWAAFKGSAVSSFDYVEGVGLLFGWQVLADALGWGRAARRAELAGLSRGELEHLVPQIDPAAVAGRLTGLDLAERTRLAEGALRGMSLTERFARIVLLVGHGSTTFNNPHAAGLDCGACGGHSGEVSARVAALVLNQAEVRAALRVRGIDIPEDTLFLAGLHDTTTDQVRLFADVPVPGSHEEDLRQLEGSLAEAGAATRRERAPRLGLEPSASLDREIAARARDWSEVRPEWGLAGNAVFIAARRERTRGVDLGGRAFLHEYRHEQDPEHRILTLIMTAPMVVASWINLQYFGSSTNNAVFGSGNKVLHNVVGRVGVIEGNGGDLRVGLPAQSVHDGRRLVHEPLRLSVFIEAPEAAIDAVLAANPAVRALVDHGWVHLFALGEPGREVRRYLRLGDWTDLGGPGAAPVTRSNVED